jgi:SAM-dependent methyltransferase
MRVGVEETTVGVEQVFADPSYARAFRSCRSPPEDALRQYLDKLEVLLDRSGARPVILDAGCGPGAFTIPLASLARRRGGRVIALDRSPVMLDGVRRAVALHGAGDVVTVLQRDVLSARLPAPCAVVWASDLLHTVSRIDDFSRSARRLAGRAGAVAIRMSSHAQLRSYEWGAFFPEALEVDLRRHYDTGAVCDSLHRSGFRDIEVEEIDESRWMPTTDYLRLFEARYLSSLRLIDDGRFAAGLARMRGALGSRASVLRNARTTLISAEAA